MTQEIKDIRLVIEIKNKEPIELIDLTKSLISLANQFNTYVSTHTDSKEGREAKLFVKEIKSGSVILDLVEYSTFGILPFLENVNTIIGFADYCKTAFNSFLGKGGDKPILKESDYKDFSSILNPIAKDNASQLNVSTTVNGDVNLHVSLNSIDANALQNMFKTEIDKLKLPQSTDQVYTRVLFYWYQAKSDTSKDVGNKAVIESISTSPLKVIFESENLKEEMLKGEDNPFTHAFIVDAKLDTIQGKPTIYKIIKVHEKFLREA